MSVEILSTATQLYEKSHFEMLAVGNDLEGDSRSSELPLFDHLLLVVCNNNNSMLHRFRDITVYVTGCE